MARRPRLPIDDMARVQALSEAQTPDPADEHGLSIYGDRTYMTADMPCEDDESRPYVAYDVETGAESDEKGQYVWQNRYGYIWDYQLARRYENIILWRQVAFAHAERRRMIAEHQAGLVTFEQFRREHEAADKPYDSDTAELETLYDNATEYEEHERQRQDAPEVGRGRKIRMRDYVSLKQVTLATPGGPQPVYGAVAGRYWVGDRGRSELISGSAFLFNPVLKDDQEWHLVDVQTQFKANVCQQLAQRAGLEIQPTHPDLDRIEWMIEWEADDELIPRVRAYEHGLTRMGVQRIAPGEMTGADVSNLAAALGLKRPQPRGQPLEIPKDPPADEVALLEVHDGDEVRQYVDGVEVTPEPEAPDEDPMKITPELMKRAYNNRRDDRPRLLGPRGETLR